MLFNFYIMILFEKIYNTLDRYRQLGKTYY